MGFIGFMGGFAGSKRGGALAYSTVVAYLREVRARLEEHWNRKLPHCESPIVQRCLKGAKKMLGDSKQKARPVTLPELEQLVAGLQPTIKDVAFRVLVLSAFWGCFRLGNVAPSVSTNKDQRYKMWPLMVNGNDVREREDGSLELVLRYSKTNQYKERLHLVRLYPIAGSVLCPVRAWKTLRVLRQMAGLAEDVPLAQYGAGMEETWTADAVKRMLKAQVVAVPATAFQKGHLTGHSFRRGFVRLAIENGIGPEFIVLHGDWKRSETVQDYAEGAAVGLDLVQRLWPR